MVFLERTDPLDRWVQEVNLGKEEDLDSRELLVLVVTMALLERLGNLDLQALLDLQDFQVLQDLRAKLVLPVPQAPVDLPGQEENQVLKGNQELLVLQVLEDVMEAQVQKAHQVLLAFLALRD